MNDKSDEKVTTKYDLCRYDVVLLDSHPSLKDVIVSGCISKQTAALIEFQSVQYTAAVWDTSEESARDHVLETIHDEFNQYFTNLFKAQLDSTTKAVISHACEPISKHLKITKHQSSSTSLREMPSRMTTEQPYVVPLLVERKGQLYETGQVDWTMALCGTRDAIVAKLRRLVRTGSDSFGASK